MAASLFYPWKVQTYQILCFAEFKFKMIGSDIYEAFGVIFLIYLLCFTTLILSASIFQEQSQQKEVKVDADKNRIIKGLSYYNSITQLQVSFEKAIFLIASKLLSSRITSVMVLCAFTLRNCDSDLTKSYIKNNKIFQVHKNKKKTNLQQISAR